MWRVLEGPIDPPSPVKANRLNLGGELPASPLPKALLGRNCLLGNLVDSRFTCITSISESEAVVCTSRGEICIIDDTEGQQQLLLAKNIEFRIHCIAKDTEDESLWIGGKSGSLKRENISELLQMAKSNQAPSRVRQSSIQSSQSSYSPALSPTANSARKRDMLALASILGKLVILDSDHGVSIACHMDGEAELDMKTTLPAHKDAVQGVEVIQIKDQKPGFVTWSRDGTVKCWNSFGDLQISFDVQLEQLDNDDELEFRNELKVVRPTQNGEHFVTGDRYGVVR